MLFRIILCSLDGIRHHGIGNGHIALSVCLDLLTLRRGGDIGFVHIGALDDGGIVVNGTLPIIEDEPPEEEPPPPPVYVQ